MVFTIDCICGTTHTILVWNPMDPNLLNSSNQYFNKCYYPINSLTCPDNSFETDILSDMRIVPVGSSGQILGYFWFLKMTRENQPFWDILSGLCPYILHQ
jgi:hypothetical protein